MEKFKSDVRSGEKKLFKNTKLWKLMKGYSVYNRRKLIREFGLPIWSDGEMRNGK